MHHHRLLTYDLIQIRHVRIRMPKIHRKIHVYKQMIILVDHVNIVIRRMVITSIIVTMPMKQDGQNSLVRHANTVLAVRTNSASTVAR